MIIRDGRPDERNALEDLQRRASLMWDEYRPFLLANPDAIALPLDQLRNGCVRVADAGAPLGFAVLLAKGKVAELDGLFVEPAQWGRGVGRALMQDATARARAGGARVLETTANPRAEDFYARLGFAVGAVVRTQFGPANRMRLQLFPPQT